MLGPSTDERDELEDELFELEGIPFIAAETFMEQYGDSFELFWEDNRLQVRTAGQAEQPETF